MLGLPDKHDRICITDCNGSIVKLNDPHRTELRFNECERPRAERILKNLNDHVPTSPLAPFKLVPLIGESPI